MPVITIEEPQVDEFVDFSWRLNSGDPLWIPPIRARLRQELTGADAFGRYGRLHLFGCMSGGHLVGRLAALLNPRLTDANGRPVGQIGYFEAIDDVGVSAALFEAAFEWLRSHGAREAWGPMNGGAHRLHRLMTSGFDQPPFLFEPRNPPYYQRLFEACGFTSRRTWYSVDVSRDRLRHTIGRLDRSLTREQAATRFEVLRLDPTDPAVILQQLHPLLDTLWNGHIGYASLDLAEFAEVFGPALSLMTAGDISAVISRDSRQELGYIFSYPDLAAEVRALDGDASGWGAWGGRGQHARRLVMHTVATAPEARRSGAAQMLMRECFAHCVEDYQEGVMALVTEEFAYPRRIAPPTREYALFAHSLD